ncbi:hypothetical protein QR680_008691 [Steinernema hermaphroditum]|uniref:Acid phosphatase n=1 Tax=Steinernema hermaphroditum TaxID=289476 RepID=A0AA39IIY2_9BILA|nr:hypothetical protein QR680_008691 [Steinernema hermaphroditum]
MNTAALLLTVVAFSTNIALIIGADLLLIQSLWRHGDRVPVGTYPTDPHQEDAWPVPWGELTTKGMWELYRQGAKLKEEYIEKTKFISANYSVHEIYVRSTDTPRTLVSAYSNLAGFYSDSRGTLPGEARWPMRWTPNISVTKIVDVLASPHLSANAGTRSRTAQDLFDLIESNAKTNVSHPFEMYDFAYTLAIERLHGLKPPEWVTDDVFNRSLRVANDEWDFLFGASMFGKEENVELVSFGCGVIKEMIENMETKINGSDGGKHKYKYYAYSGHDTTIGSVLTIMGAKEAILGHTSAAYGATLVLELWRMETDVFAVRLRYSKNAETPFETITDKIEGCPPDEYCPFEVFVANRRKYILKDIRTSCEAESEV